MMDNLKMWPFIFAVALMVIPLTSHTNAIAQQTVNNHQLHQLFDAYHEENLKLDPILATMLGDSRYNDQLTADDEVHLKKLHGFNTKYLARLKEFDPDNLTKEDRISYLILKNKLESALRMEKYHLEYMPIDQASSLPLGFALWGSGSG